MAHGHLAMGGLTIVDPAFEKDNSEDTHGQVLSYECYKEFASNPDTNFESPKITVAEIKDRSKGDFLSKLIAIFQTTWFILQCIARGQQGLALTELELVILTLASLNAVTYMFWWHKPLGLQDPIRIYFKNEAVTTSGGHLSTLNENSNTSSNDVISKVGEVLTVRTLQLMSLTSTEMLAKKSYCCTARFVRRNPYLALPYALPRCLNLFPNWHRVSPQDHQNGTSHRGAS